MHACGARSCGTRGLAVEAPGLVTVSVTRDVIDDLLGNIKRTAREGRVMHTPAAVSADELEVEVRRCEPRRRDRLHLSPNDMATNRPLTQIDDQIRVAAHFEINISPGTPMVYGSTTAWLALDEYPMYFDSHCQRCARTRVC